MRLLALLLAFCLAAPLASAGPVPVLYFFKDGEGSDGLLERYVPIDNNIPRDNVSKTRTIVVGQELVLPVRFIAPADDNFTDWRLQPSRLLEQPVLLLWLEKSVVVEGDLVATLYRMDDGGPLALSTGMVALDADTNQTPAPEDLVPPEPTVPPDPSYAERAAGHALAQVLPLVLRPPAVIFMESVDDDVGAAPLAIGFHIQARDGSTLPVPQGLFATLQYDGVLTPSLLLLPWYAPDDNAPSPTTKPVTPTKRPGASPTPSEPTPAEAESPGIGFAMLLALLAVVALRRRR